MLEVQYYRTAAGACPVEEFLDSLNAKQVQKVLWDDLWEVRAEFGGDAFRLLGFWDAGRLIILTNGFAKKTQKTPEREMALAEQRKRDYLSRKK
jgi:phage-related protein